MPEFDGWFPTSLHGNPEINVGSFGSIADGTGHPLGAGGSAALGYATLVQAQTEEILWNGRMVGPYPSATSLSDYADWCAITEAVKAAFSTDGVLHLGDGYKNRPLTFPAGIYIINKPILIRGVSDALIRGTGYWTQIYNETNTEPDNICIQAEGIRYSRIENFTFGAVGPNSIAFNLTHSMSPSFNSHGNVWITVNFTANGVGGVGCSMGTGGYMGSEQTFIRCTADNNTYGWLVANPNALSYLFLTCLANRNSSAGIRVNTGGGVTCINCAFSQNGDFGGETGWDIDNYANGSINMISCRSESRRFVRSGGYVFVLGCTHGQNEKECVLVHSDKGAQIITTDCMQSRLDGSGEFRIETSVFSQAAYYFQGISNSGGLVKITHASDPNWAGAGYEEWEHWRDGDEVEIVQVQGTTYPTAPSVNGVWIIHKIDRNNFELVGSTYVADTYKNMTTGEPAGTKGYMKPGPRYHLTSTLVRPPPIPARAPGLAAIKSMPIKWADSGTTVTNVGAPGALTFDLPQTSATSWMNTRGTHYRFVVIEPFAVTVQITDGAGTTEFPRARIFRAGGYATAGLQVTSNVVGNSIELMLVDGEGASWPSLTPKGGYGHRWLIVSETGTWTISGTP